MIELHFIRPDWFYALIPLLVLLGLLYRIKRSHHGWRSFCDQRLLPYLLTQDSGKKSRYYILLLLFGGLLGVIALAGPSWEKRPLPVFKKQSALILILDLSASMDVQDVKPSRLIRARHKVIDILKARKEGQTALIVFAGQAFSVTPLTDDTETIISQVKSLTPSIMPTQGSNADSALKLSLKLFEQASQLTGDVILVTDGVDVNSLKTARQMADKGFRLSVLAVGTNEGGPIALENGGFLRDNNGTIIIAGVDFSLLRQLALNGTGQLQELTPNDRDINRLLAPIQKMHIEDNAAETELNTDTWYEAGPYLLLLLIPLAAYGFRKGVVTALLVCVMFPLMPDQSMAFEWSSLWKNNNQQAREQLQNNNAKEAAQQFNDPSWKAAALYKSGQYQQALDIYNKFESPDSETLYNKANTLARLGNIEQAIKTYEQALKLAPKHEDAKHNRDLLKQMQQQNQQQQNDRSDQSQQQKDSSQSDSNQNASDNADGQQQKGSSGSSAQDQNNKEGEQAENDKSKQAQTSGQQNQQQKAEQNDQGQQQSDAQKQQDKQGQQQADAQKQQDKQGMQHQGEQPAKQNQPMDANEKSEQQHATEQWLRRIPDDPGGLLKRKFHYQSQLQQFQQQNLNGQAQW